MASNRYLVFLKAIFVSGIVSAGSVPVDPLGLFVPGIAFAIALLTGLKECRLLRDQGNAVVFVIVVTVAFYAAMVAAILVVVSSGFAKGYYYNSIAGGIAGAVGASIIGTVLFCMVAPSCSLPKVILIVVVGALIDALFFALGIYLADEVRFRHPLGILFFMWQIAVGLTVANAISVPQCGHKSIGTDEHVH